MTSPYFAGPLIDWTLAGLGSIVLYFVFLALGDRSITGVEVSQFAVLYLVWFGNAPHFSATSYRSRCWCRRRPRQPAWG